MTPTGATGTRFGVVLMNMGGPDTLADIQPYLQRVLADRHIVRLPGGALYQPLFARLVSRRRARVVNERYAAIGGGSPLLAETKVVREALAEALAAPVAIAMRYSAPGADDAVAELAAQGVETLVGVPLYPQYSTSTTRSSLEDLFRAAAGRRVVVVDRHPQCPGLVEALAHSVEEGLAAAGTGKGTHVLFTAHSIPLKYTATGDPYIGEVRATVDAVVRRLGADVPHSLALQSAARFGEWHGPTLEEALETLVSQGVRRLVVQPVSFVSENLETLYDLDIVFRRLALERGLERFDRRPAPGRTAAYVQGLAALVREAVDGRRVEHA